VRGSGLIYSRFGGKLVVRTAIVFVGSWLWWSARIGITALRLSLLENLRLLPGCEPWRRRQSSLSHATIGFKARFARAT
jgi:hypothetical protein